MEITTVNILMIDRVLIGVFSIRENAEIHAKLYYKDKKYCIWSENIDYPYPDID